MFEFPLKLLQKIILKRLHCVLVNGLINLELRIHTDSGPLGNRGTRGGDSADMPRTPGSGSGSACTSATTSIALRQCCARRACSSSKNPASGPSCLALPCEALPCQALPCLERPSIRGSSWARPWASFYGCCNFSSIYGFRRLLLSLRRSTKNASCLWRQSLRRNEKKVGIRYSRWCAPCNL